MRTWTRRPGAGRGARQWLAVGLVGGLAALAAACGSSASPAASGSSSTSQAGGSGSAVTVRTATVTGLGTVLVDDAGRTLYVLSSERGGHVTCTSADGCTNVWPAVQLPKGTTSATAGSGATSSLLGTVQGSGGALRVTYGGWPLYTYAGDAGPGQASGQGITSFGGTWYALSPSGSPVTATSTGTSGSSGGYGY